MAAQVFQPLLAETKKDDSLFFNEALLKIYLSTHLTSRQKGELFVNNFEDDSIPIPQIIFHDRNINGIFGKKESDSGIDHTKQLDFKQIQLRLRSPIEFNL